LLQAETECKQIDALADEFQKRMGRRPARVSELVQAGLLQRLPLDPLGYSYVFGPDGHAALNTESPLLEQQLLKKK
jgi:hypothetical protein